MLTRQVQSQFSKGTRSRGSQYYYLNNVKINRFDPKGAVEAVVTGTQPYNVLVDIERQPNRWDVEVFCDCPFVEENLEFCKHIWATLMAMDARPELGRVPKHVSLNFTDSVGGDEDLDEDEESDLISAAARIPEGIRREFEEFGLLALLNPFAKKRNETTKKVPPKPAEPPAWSRLLTDLASRSMTKVSSKKSVSTPIQPVYVLEGAPVTKDAKLVISLARWNQAGNLTDLTLKPEDVSRIPSELDRRICLMLVGAGNPQSSYYYRSYYSSRSNDASWEVPDAVRPTLLPLLFETDRFYHRGSKSEPATSLNWDEGPPWEFNLRVHRKKDDAPFVISSVVRRGDETRNVCFPALLYRGDPCLLVHKGIMSRVQSHGCFDWMSELCYRGDLPVNLSERQQFMGDLAKFSHLPPVDWPSEWNVQTLSGLTPAPTLELVFDEEERKGTKYVHGSIRFKYEDVEVLASRGGSVVLDAASSKQIVRQIDVEKGLMNRVTELGMTSTRDERLRLPQKRLPGFVATLLDEKWTVIGNRTLFRTSGEFKLDVTTGIDWFDLDGYMDFDGQRVALPQLLAAVRKGERFVRLGDGTMGLLPEEWLKKHEALLGLGEVDGDRVRFTKTQVGVVDALLAQLPEARFDEQLATARQKFRSFNGVEVRQAPESFTGTLRGYQQEGLGWMNFLRDFGWNGCLADDMGLGKTIQVLALLAERKQLSDQGPSLIVMPKSLIFNWMREAGRFAPQLRVLNYTGGERQQVRDAFHQADLVVTTYGTLRRDIESLREHEFNYVMLDEAQAAKNPDSLNAKCARLLRGKHKLVLTGTPVENHVGDLWSLFEFLNPGMLGKQKAFNSAFRSKNGNGASPHTNTDLLQRMLRPFILRRTKEQVAPELPQRSEQTIECAMPPKQAAYYTELRDYYRKSLMGRLAKQGMKKSKVQILEALLRLRQAACHPGLIDEKKSSVESAKLETLMPMLDELIDGGHKALVFSQFTSFLSIVREQLAERKIVYEYLDGQTEKRDERVDRFQNDAQCPLFLISLKAGGVGLNLTAADYVFLLDPWWNPAVEAQAIDRTHRIGQEKKVIAYRLITRDTVEAKIMELQQRKRDLAGAIITQANSMLQDLTKEDLALLLS